MIHVTKTREWNFEIPDRCVDCPMRKSDQLGNSTIELCLLKKNKRWEDNTINHMKSVYPNSTIQFFRDKNCPLKDGSSYVI